MHAVLGAKKTILVVDDAHENISIIKAILVPGASCIIHDETDFRAM